METATGKEEIAKRIRACMKAKGVSGYRVAKETGIDPVNVTRWIRGMAVPTLRNLQKLSEYFGVSFEYLALGRGE